MADGPKPATELEQVTGATVESAASEEIARGAVSLSTGWFWIDEEDRWYPRFILAPTTREAVTLTFSPAYDWQQVKDGRAWIALCTIGDPESGFGPAKTLGGRWVDGLREQLTLAVKAAITGGCHRRERNPGNPRRAHLDHRPRDPLANRREPRIRERREKGRRAEWPAGNL